MDTLLGEIDEKDLVKEVAEADCPAGKTITTRYFYQGELVRQDVTVEVTKAPSIGSGGWDGTQRKG